MGSRVRNTLVVLLAIENPQDSEEEVDDVEVKRDRCCNLLLNMVVAHHKLRIDQDVSAENQGSDGAVDQFYGTTVREESRHEAEDDENPEAAEEIRHPRRKVVLGLACEDCQGDKDSRGDDERFQNNLRLVEGHDDRDGVSLKRRETAQEEQICRV